MLLMVSFLRQLHFLLCNLLWKVLGLFCVNFSRNILVTQTENYLKSCHYNASHQTDRYCPVFTLGTIINATNTDYNKIALQVRFAL